MTTYELINNIYGKWKEAVSTIVGENCSMENSATVAKLPYATLYFQGVITTDSDLQGNESSITPTLQVDIYIKKQRALYQAYEIDEASHKVLNGIYGMRRSYGPELIQSTDPSIKRLTSRYTRLFGLGDKLPE